MVRKKQVSRVIKVEDEAIVLKLRKHGETSAVMQMLTRGNGLYHGVVRSISSKNNRGLYQPGNVIAAEWSARIADHIGSIKGESISPHAAHIMQQPKALAALSSICALLVAALPERHAYTKLYNVVLELLEMLAAGDEAHYLPAYAQFELLLLSECGFGLDLSHCAATGQTNDLIYISPKSGRAVSREAGEPYKNKMLKMPDNDQDYPTILTITGYFLEHWLFEAHHKKLPTARDKFVKMLYKQG